MKKVIYIMLALCINCGFAQEKSSANEVFEISDMKFEYNLFYSGSVPRTKGKLYLSISLNKPVESIGLVNTKAHYVLDGDVFFSTKTMNDIISESTTNYLLESATELDWGVYFKAFVILKNKDEESQYVYSDLYCTTDLLSEEDKQIIREYADAPITLTENNQIRYVDKSLMIQSEYGGNLKIFSLEGLPIYSVNFEADGVVNLGDGLPNIFIVVVNFDNGKVETKTIAK